MKPVEKAHEELRRALREGRDTSAIRREIERLEAEEAKAALLEEEEALAHTARLHAEIGVRANELAVAFDGQLRELLANLAPPAPPFAIL